MSNHITGGWMPSRVIYHCRGCRDFAQKPKKKGEPVKYDEENTNTIVRGFFCSNNCQNDWEDHLILNGLMAKEYARDDRVRALLGHPTLDRDGIAWKVFYNHNDKVYSLKNKGIFYEGPVMKISYEVFKANPERYAARGSRYILADDGFPMVNYNIKGMPRVLKRVLTNLYEFRHEGVLPKGVIDSALDTITAELNWGLTFGELDKQFSHYSANPDYYKLSSNNDMYTQERPVGKASECWSLTRPKLGNSNLKLQDERLERGTSNDMDVDIFWESNEEDSPFETPTKDNLKSSKFTAAKSFTAHNGVYDLTPVLGKPGSFINTKAPIETRNNFDMESDSDVFGGRSVKGARSKLKNFNTGDPWMSKTNSEYVVDSSVLTHGVNVGKSGNMMLGKKTIEGKSSAWLKTLPRAKFRTAFAFNSSLKQQSVNVQNSPAKKTDAQVSTPATITRKIPSRAKSFLDMTMSAAAKAKSIQKTPSETKHKEPPTSSHRSQTPALFAQMERPKTPFFSKQAAPKVSSSHGRTGAKTPMPGKQMPFKTPSKATAAGASFKSSKMPASRPRWR